MPNEEILKRITGGFDDEGVEAAYRTAASILVNAVGMQLIDPFWANSAPKTKKWRFGIRFWRLIERSWSDKVLKSLSENKQVVGEAFISFALAAVFEFTPLPKIPDDIRKRLAYNLRVRSYEKIPELMLRVSPEIGGKSVIGFIQDATERAIAVTKLGQIREGGLKSGAEPPSTTSEMANAT